MKTALRGVAVSIAQALAPRFAASLRYERRLRRGHTSDVSGTALIRVPNNKPGRGTIEPANTISGLGTVSTQRTRTSRLDDVRLPGPVGFIKIDVEGHELAVLRGGLSVLERDQPQLLVEIEERHRPHSLEETSSLLTQLNYRGYFFDGCVLRPIEKFDASQHQQPSVVPYINNFMFVVHDRCDLLIERIRAAQVEGSFPVKLSRA